MRTPCFPPETSAHRPAVVRTEAANTRAGPRSAPGLGPASSRWKTPASSVKTMLMPEASKQEGPKLGRNTLWFSKVWSLQMPPEAILATMRRDPRGSCPGLTTGGPAAVAATLSVSPPERMPRRSPNSSVLPPQSAAPAHHFLFLGHPSPLLNLTWSVPAPTPA